MENSKAQVSNKEIVFKLIDLSLKHRRVMQNYLEVTGVYHSQHRLLMVIAHNPHASQIEIAKIMDVTPVTISISLKKLEKGGYIIREVGEEDNRFHKIILTEKGNKVVEQSKGIFRYAEQLLLNDFTEEEKIQLYNLLKKLDDNINLMDEEIKLTKERK